MLLLLLCSASPDMLVVNEPTGLLVRVVNLEENVNDEAAHSLGLWVDMMSVWTYDILNTQICPASVEYVLHAASSTSSNR